MYNCFVQRLIQSLVIGLFWSSLLSVICVQCSTVALDHSVTFYKIYEGMTLKWKGLIASYPGLLTTAFVAFSTSAEKVFVMYLDV